MMAGYLKAIDQLAEENLLTFSNEYIKVTRELINTVRGRKIRIPLFIKSLQKTTLLHILNTLPRISELLIQEEKTRKKPPQKFEADQLIFRLEDPEKYLLMPTPRGLVPLSDRTNVETFAAEIMSERQVSNMEVKEIGGVLNTVYLLTLRENGEERKVVVKKFEDWLGFKWFPLALWTLGTKSFAVLGRSRLEREYAINQFLRSHGFAVPKILHISHKERLIFQEFVEGENLVATVQKIISSKKNNSESAAVKEVGRKIAEAHKLGVSLGDCKPENIILARDGRTVFVDLEQASRDGNLSWDIAEFLYYSGHYASPLSSADSAKLITTEFIKGYLEAGGDTETIKKAGSARYTTIFGIFTPPQVILAISNICNEMGTYRESQHEA
jgi:tRNA A-37 threonylcarbamoyl transferase component Bud32